MDRSIVDVNRGGGAKGTFRESITLLLLTTALLLAIHFAIGLIVSAFLPHISIEREHQWFSSFQLPQPNKESPYDSQKKALETDSNPALNRAEAILQRLVASPDVPNLDYQLVHLSDAAPNAFAFPGGTIGVTSGLLELTETDEVSLAFILAHELGHFVHRDHLKGIGRQVGRSLAWAVLFGNDPSGLFSIHANHWLDMDYSREQESAADQFAIQLVHQVYGNMEGSGRFFEWLENHSSHPAWVEWWMSHPEPTRRRQDLEKEMDRLKETVP
jgi:Zn-dependent protease with chaperone function